MREIQIAEALWLFEDDQGVTVHHHTTEGPVGDAFGVGVSWESLKR